MITIQVPDDFAESVHLQPQELGKEMRLLAAIKMYELGRLSSGRAAEVAGLDRTSFVELCSKLHVPAANYLPGELDAELGIARDDTSE